MRATLILLATGALALAGCGGASTDDLRSAGRDLLALPSPPGLPDGGGLTSPDRPTFEVDGHTFTRTCDDCAEVVRQFGTAVFDDIDDACALIRTWLDELGGELDSCEDVIVPPSGDGVVSNSSASEVEIRDEASDRTIRVGFVTTTEIDGDAITITIQPFLATDA